MTKKGIINLLKVSVTLGFCLILLGIYLHLFSDTIDEMGLHGIIISAMCVAFGMALSLPTKMYLTLLLMQHEKEHDEAEKLKHAQDDSDIRS
ncbi:hypothetical protein L2735_03120 [Shewanella olleyana]|uniref:hypothetical protein n=1 Tax=Shewanella olleyana TaxID=135626 RepID=UPI00200D5463|nr:hypothetical protein [Shewanella olleyana]MCL1065796.1 hypothetical protein [Shewanella olleyana]